MTLPDEKRQFNKKNFFLPSRLFPSPSRKPPFLLHFCFAFGIDQCG